jgi:murein DD-endopeptidase MepM/ murein hydrolase activator NlpD
MMTRWKDLLFIIPLTGIAVLAALLLPGELPPAATGDPMEEEPTVQVREPVATRMLYGIPVDSLLVWQGRVRQGESLADLLFPHGINVQQIYNISLFPDSLIDERKIQPGNSYTILSKGEGLPVCFVYEKDPLNYVRIRFYADSIRAENGHKEVERRLQVASGTIESSLWESMLSDGYNPMLAIELSEIFAWSIDFFGIQQGDRYKVIYEESYVDSQSIGINRINGAWFCHNGTEFWGIPFEQDGRISFFDEEGNSLRKAFLKAPLRFSRISSGFSSSRYHPILKIRRPHHGVDYAAPAGTPVQTVGDGVVTDVGYQKGGGGNYVKIKHNSVYSTTYMHLSRFGKGIHGGVYVKQGDVIGYVGSTGLASGPHLDFRFYRNGSAVNPLNVEAPPVEPVHEENLQAFGIRKNLTMASLKLIQ